MTTTTGTTGTTLAAQIAARAAAAQREEGTEGTSVELKTKDSKPAEPERSSKGKTFQMPSAPTTLFLGKKRIPVPDGRYWTEDPDELRELEAGVASGSIFEVGAGDLTLLRTKPPKPFDPSNPD